MYLIYTYTRYIYNSNLMVSKKNVARHQLLMLMKTKTKNSCIKSNQQRLNLILTMVWTSFATKSFLKSLLTRLPALSLEQQMLQRSCAHVLHEFERQLPSFHRMAEDGACGCWSEESRGMPRGLKGLLAFLFFLSQSFMTSTLQNK